MIVAAGDATHLLYGYQSRQIIGAFGKVVSLILKLAGVSKEIGPFLTRPNADRTAFKRPNLIRNSRGQSAKVIDRIVRKTVSII